MNVLVLLFPRISFVLYPLFVRIYHDYRFAMTVKDAAVAAQVPGIHYARWRFHAPVPVLAVMLLLTFTFHRTDQHV